MKTKMRDQLNDNTTLLLTFTTRYTGLQYRPQIATLTMDTRTDLKRPDASSAVMYMVFCEPI